MTHDVTAPFHFGDYLTAAWAIYSADTRLRVQMPEGQQAPDDYGVFKEALWLAGATGMSDLQWLEFTRRAYRHYNNEKLLNGKAAQAAFAVALAMAYNEYAAEAGTPTGYFQ